MTEQWQELKETITEMRDNDGTGTQQDVCKFLADYMEVLEKQMQEPCEDTVSRAEAIDKLTKFYNMVLDDNGTKLNIRDIVGILERLPSVTPRMNLVETSQDCISREEVLNALDRVGNLKMYENCDLFAEHYAEYVRALPSVTPKYTDEEIDRAQAVEQAYVDKMVELAVKETKERYSDAVKKIRRTIDEMTEIHSDGEFYIKNIDAKWIISKYLCGAEMSRGGEDEETK